MLRMIKKILKSKQTPTRVFAPRTKTGINHFNYNKFMNFTL